MDTPIATCPRCGKTFPFTPADQQKTHDQLQASMAPGYDAHVQTCKGTFHELSPDGKGWTKELKAWEDQSYWTNPNHPAKQPGKLKFDD